MRVGMFVSCVYETKYERIIQHKTTMTLLSRIYFNVIRASTKKSDYLCIFCNCANRLYQLLSVLLFILVSSLQTFVSYSPEMEDFGKRRVLCRDDFGVDDSNAER